MKKTLVVGLAIGMVSMAATFALAKSPTQPIPAQGGFGGQQKNVGGNGIVLSSHDLSGNSASDSFVTGTKDLQSRICVFCHHPHNSKATGTDGDQTGAAAMTYSPLWNRDMSTKTFNPYNNGGFTSTTNKSHALQAVSSGLKGVSLLCMSCHDGVVAMNAYSRTSGSDMGSRTIAGNIDSSAGFVNRGGASDMSNHHPMGFNYAAVAALDDEIAQPSTVMVPAGLTQAGGTVDTSVGVTIDQLLDASNLGSTGNMECVTCHDVHNTKNAPGAERFLWRSNNGSNFCLTCHLK